MKYLMSWFVVCVASTALSLPGCARSQDSLEVMDGMPIGISEAAFKSKRPDAINLSDSRQPSTSGFVYFPSEKTKYFEHIVTGYSRGFENGQGCFSSFGVEKLNTSEVTVLKERIRKSVDGTVYPEYRAGNAQSVIGRFSNKMLRASFSITETEKDKSLYTVGVSVSLASCDENLAKNLWKTFPK